MHGAHRNPALTTTTKRKKEKTATIEWYSRVGARVAQHDKYIPILRSADRLLWAKIQIPVGPWNVGTLSPNSSSISAYIQNCSNHFFHVAFTLSLAPLFICYLRLCFLKPSIFKVQRHFEDVLYSTLVRIGMIQQNTVIKTRYRCNVMRGWHSQSANIRLVSKRTDDCFYFGCSITDPCIRFPTIF